MSPPAALRPSRLFHRHRDPHLQPRWVDVRIVAERCIAISHMKQRKRARRLCCVEPGRLGLERATGRRVEAMLYTLAVILLVLWLLGLVSGYTVGAFIHLLLVVAIVLIVVQLLTGRRTV